jgi:transposase
MSKLSRRNYTEEFKREAVKLTEQGSRSVSDVARSLGVHRSLIERWRQQYGESNGVSKSVSEAEREELKRLRAEVKQLRMERDILKKATAFFAKEVS